MKEIVIRLTSQSDKDKLMQERAELVVHLEEIREVFASHILAVHKGKPATSCHKCMVYSQGIIADEANIRDIDSSLSQ